MWRRELCLMLFELSVGMDVTKRDISKKMIGCVKQFHSAYQNAKQLKKEKQSAEENHASEDRKKEKERQQSIVFSNRKSKCWLS